MSTKTTRELYEEKTGNPWSTAKTSGLTTGSYKDNLALRKKLLGQDSFSGILISKKEESFNKDELEIENKIKSYLLTKYAKELSTINSLNDTDRNKLLDKISADSIAESILITKPRRDKTREEYLNSLSKDEELFLKSVRPEYNPSIKNDVYNAYVADGLFGVIPKLIGFSDVPNRNEFSGTDLEFEEYKKDREESPLLSRYANQFKAITSALDYARNYITASYKDNYTVKQAITGEQNDAGVGESIITDPLTYVGGAGILKSALKTSVKETAKVLKKPILRTTAIIGGAALVDKSIEEEPGQFKDYYSEVFNYDENGKITGLK